MIEAKWDLDFYRKFLSEAEQKPTLETQVQLIKAYCEAVDQYLQQDLNIEPQDLENESVEDIQKIVEKTKYEARLELAAARLEKLDKRLSDRKAKEAAAAAQAPADSTDPKDPSKPVESK